MSSKGAKAKAAAKKRIATQVAPDAANEAPEAPSSAGARKGPKYGGGQLKSQCAHYFSRVATGKATKASSDEVAEAKNALQTFQDLDDVGKLEFAKAFYSNKGTKSFGFVKDYSEKAHSSKTVKETIEENYMTRTDVVDCRMSSCRAHFEKFLDIDT